MLACATDPVPREGASVAAIGLKTDLRSLAHIGLKPVLLLLAETLWLVGLMLIGLRVLGQ